MTAAAAIAVATTAAASLAFPHRAAAFPPLPARFAPPSPLLRAHNPPPNPRRRRFGTRTYWDESYELNDDDEGGGDGAVFSWYCGWHDELRPFVMEALDWTLTAEGADGDSDGGGAPTPPAVLVPGVGNDGAIRDMYDDPSRRFRDLKCFDYAPKGVRLARVMLGLSPSVMGEDGDDDDNTNKSNSNDDELAEGLDVRVADCTALPACYRPRSFDLVLEKGTLDAIYISGEGDEGLARKRLHLALRELTRVLRPGGVLFSVTAAAAEHVERVMEEEFVAGSGGGYYEAMRNTREGEAGGLWTTEEGYTSNNVDAAMLVYRRTLRELEDQDEEIRSGVNPE